MNPADLRAACLALPEAREGFSFPRYPDRSVFTAPGKVFAISSLADEPLRVSLQTRPRPRGAAARHPPEDFRALRS